MNYLGIIGIVSTLCGILSFFITVFSKYSWGKRILWLVVVFILTFVSGLVVHYSSENERIKNIHRQACSICEHYNSSSFNDEFVQESLAFLEENRDMYPDSYNRAEQIYQEIKESEYPDYYGAARKMHGILKGIATLNEK